jgi:hypothetical protein
MERPPRCPRDGYGLAINIHILLFWRATENIASRLPLWQVFSKPLGPSILVPGRETNSLSYTISESWPSDDPSHHVTQLSEQFS